MANKRKGINSSPVQKAFKENDVKSRTELYNLRASKVGCVYLGDETIGTQVLADWKCSKGHVFQCKPNDISQGCSCPYCNSNGIKYVLLRNNCKTVDEYGHKLALENPNGIKYVGGYINNKTKAEWECGKGHKWKATPNNIKYHGRGCPYCNGINDIKYVLFRNNCETLDEYGHKIASESSNNIKYIGGFVGTFIKAEWGCNRSNHRWKAKPNDIKNGNGCPKCGRCISKKEQALFLEVQKVYPEAINNTRKLLKNHRYELDIFIPNLNKAVEFDGDHWHAFPDAIRRDTEKNEQCAEAGITLHRVEESDWDKDKDAVVKNVLEFLKAQSRGCC
jgi:very-short-patch-repair endonuclease